jgi:glycine cleavage system H protein
MTDVKYMETTFDKFTFRVREDYLYHSEECWIREDDGGPLTVGITDFQQIIGGDVAFIETIETETAVKQGEQIGILETIKSTLTLIAPISGVIKEVNIRLEDDPQLINLDPYGDGWIYKILPSGWTSEQKNLMDARTYFPQMEEKIRREMEK